MKTIHERACDYVTELFDNIDCAPDEVRDAYESGAEEQQKIDIDMAIKEFNKFLIYLYKHGRINRDEVMQDWFVAVDKAIKGKMFNISNNYEE